MFGMNLAAAINAVNDWGKHYWGVLLVLLAISYFGSNLVRNIRNTVWAIRTRRIRNANRLAMTSTPYRLRPSLGDFSLGNNRPQPTLGGMLNRSTDMELANSLSYDRLERLNGLQAYMRAGD